MNDDGIDDLEPLSWIDEIQEKATAAAAGELSRVSAVSLPVPAKRTDGDSAVAVFLYPVAPASERTVNRIYAPEIAVFVDPLGLAALEIRRLRPAIDAADDAPLGGDANDAARNLPVVERDALNCELSFLHEYAIEHYAREELSAEQIRYLARWQALFALLVPAGLFPHYRQLAPEFFTRVERITGKGYDSREAPPAERGGGFSFGGEALQVPAHEIAADTIAGALHELGLRPALVSPLADIEPRPGRRGLTSLLNLAPESSAADWQWALQVLSAPQCAAAVIYGNEGFAARTCFFGPADRGGLHWVRFTAKPEESATPRFMISFAHKLDVIERMMTAGLKSKEIGIAEQIVYTVSLDEWTAILAFADLAGTTPGREKLAAPVDASSLVWEKLAAVETPTWCLAAAVAFPGLVQAPELLLASGLAKLEAQQWLTRDGTGFSPAPKLRALVRSLERPMAHATLEVSRYEGDRAIIRRLTALRTGRKLWIWEAAQSHEEEKPLEEIQINVFQATHVQFAAILDHFLGTAASGRTEGARR